jgi:predicted transcriptional regulator
LGYITRADLYTAIESAVDKGMHKSAPAFLADSLQIQNPPPGYADISSYVDEFPILIIPETPLDILLDIFKGIGLRCAMVINSNDELVGIIKKKDLAVFISTTVVANEFISKSRASRLSLYQSLNQEDEPFLQIHNKSLD